MLVSQDRLSLPWAKDSAENARFFSILCILIIALVALSIWIPSVNLPEKDRKSLEKLPPQLAKLVKKKKPVQKKPVPIKKEEPIKKKEVKEKKPPKKEKPKKAKEPKKKIIPKVKKPKTVKKPLLTKQIKKAREVAKKTGLLALKSNISELKKAVDLSALKSKVKPRKERTIAAKATALTSGDVLSRSSGISTSELSAPAETLKLASQDGESLTATADELALSLAEEQAALMVKRRDKDNLRLSVEALKEHINKIYNRALRTNPFLEGVLKLELVISPSGDVLACTEVSSELNDSGVSKKIINRVLLHNFGAEDVEEEKIRIPFTLRP